MKNPVLLLIDIQDGFNEIEYWGGERNNPNAEENCKKLLDAFRARNHKVIHVQHCSTEPNSPLRPEKQGNAIQQIVAPIHNETIIKKKVASAFIGTNLKEKLEEISATHLYIVGLTTDHCVSTTTRMANNLGFNTTVISDATATFPKTGINGEIYDAKLIHLTALASLKDEFAHIINTNTLLAQL